MKADILRDKFLDFFKSKGHKIMPSDSLVPKDDPTILFTPAGMNQFKKEFLTKKPTLKKVATCQRCLRTDDLDKVGKTLGHHTFFEMLGNFSFGDYFKKEAISFSWEFLTQVLKIDARKLWISVYTDDEESYNMWKDVIKVPSSKIIKLGDKENFWPAEAKLKGPNGPCGPCSELFFDQGQEVGCGRPGCNPSCNCERFVEVWNLVFTQFNRKEGQILEPLPKKNIDTGMGLERLAAVMQAVKNNFETDLFKPLLKEIINGIKNYEPKDKDSVYAVADHIRAISFGIYDGVLPSNEARGYVIRKLIRKSTLHLRTLRMKKPFLYKLVPPLSEIMRVSYPQLQERRENIAQIILAEEKGFISTLDSSEDIYKEKFSNPLLKNEPVKTGETVFQLYDTYGIPVELTIDYLKKQGFKNLPATVKVINEKMEEQKTRSKSQSTMKGSVFDVKDLDLGSEETNFLGYKKYESSAKILNIIKDNIEVKKISKGDEAKIILDKTVFYPESGGQIADTGELIKAKNIFEVLDTKKVGKVIMHIGKVKEGSFKKFDPVSSKIDVERRLDIARNHTATHLLQAALRKVLGLHVQQQGSLVAPDRLRFDFTHFKNINKEELDRIEEIVNSYIINNYPLKSRMMLLSEAKRTGALAFFGEKYEDKVRVVSINELSKELCGGTHLDYTGQIGIFKIIKEYSIASGVRRIEAVTGTFAFKMVKEEEAIVADVSSALNVPEERITQELQKRLSRTKELEKQLNTQQFDTIKSEVDTYIEKGENINGINVITHFIKGVDINVLRETVDLIKEKTRRNTIVVLGTDSNLANKALSVAGITQDLFDKDIDVSKLLKEAALEIGGSGGGRKDFAQAGGNKPQNFPNFFKKFKEAIRNLK